MHIEESQSDRLFAVEFLDGAERDLQQLPERISERVYGRLHAIAVLASAYPPPGQWSATWLQVAGVRVRHYVDGVRRAVVVLAVEPGEAAAR